MVEQSAATQLTGGLVERPGAGVVEPICIRLGGGRELVLPVSMADERVAALIHLIEGKPPTIKGRS